MMIPRDIAGNSEKKNTQDYTDYRHGKIGLILHTLHYFTHNPHLPPKLAWFQLTVDNDIDTVYNIPHAS